MPKRALIVGINDYDNFNPLRGCVSDAEAIKDALSKNDDDSQNFECIPFPADKNVRVTRATLGASLRQLFSSFDGDVLFYFSGHGKVTDTGGYLATQEGSNDDPGLPMDDLLKMAVASKARTVLMVLDCCSSGSVGDLSILQNASSSGLSLLREGITILAASRPDQDAMEVGGHGVFTRLLVGPLRGGGADIRGLVSAASMYGYAEAALGAWDQRPIYKSHAARLDPVRRCTPQAPDSEIRKLKTFFKDDAAFEMALDETYEVTHPNAIPAHVEIFKALKRLQLAGLVKPAQGTDLYFCAIGEPPRPTVVLTELGKFYWELVKKGRI